jgi:hypothetical protein
MSSDQWQPGLIRFIDPFRQHRVLLRQTGSVRFSPMYDATQKADGVPPVNFSKRYQVIFF